MSTDATASASRAATGDSIRPDVVAGLTTALVLVPQAMGYAMLAGLPPVAGLHAATLGLVAYAAIGSSPALAIGPVAMDSLLTAAALAAIGTTGPDSQLAMAGLLAVMVGTIQIAMGALRLGQLTNLISLPVLTGFTSAAALVILGSQLPVLVGLRSTSASEIVPLVRYLVATFPDASLAAGLTGVASIGVLHLLERYRPTWPRAPIVLVAATVVVELVPPLRSIPRVGAVPSSLPHPNLVVPELGDIRALAPHALTLAFVAFLEGFSVAKRYADRCGEPNPSRELVALGAANLGSALSGGFPITGGLSRSAVLVRAGVRTKLAGVVTAATMLAATLVLAPLFARLPKPALAAVVIMSVATLVDVAAVRWITTVKPSDGWFVFLAFATTLAFGFQVGILVGVAVSLASFVHESTKPHVAVLGRIPGTTSYRNVLRYPEAQKVPGMLLVRIDSQLYFGNSTFLRETMERLEAENAPVRVVVLDASGINQLDSSAESALTRLVERYESQGTKFALASVRGPVRDVMKRSGLWQRLGRDRLFLDVHSAVEAHREPSTTKREPHALSPTI